MADTEWILVFGAIAAFLNAVTVGILSTLSALRVGPISVLCPDPLTSRTSTLPAGANLTANCWGPVLGARAVNYRTAVILGIVCQTAGVLAFGPHTYTIYGGFLDSVTELKAHPELTLYAIMWTTITPVIWQALAIWWQILVPAYLGTGELLIV